MLTVVRDPTVEDALAPDECELGGGSEGKGTAVCRSRSSDDAAERNLIMGQLSSTCVPTTMNNANFSRYIVTIFPTRCSRFLDAVDCLLLRRPNDRETLATSGDVVRAYNLQSEAGLEMTA